jgi:hypothetical protein
MEADAHIWAANARRAEKRLGVLREDLDAIAAPHQDAILGPSQMGNTHGEPNSYRQQRDSKCEGSDVGQHAMSKIVRLFPITLIT